MSRRYTAGWRTAGAGSTTLPIASIYGIASRSGYLREIGVFNTTTTAWAVRLCRLSAAGTQGAGITEDKYNTNDDANDLTCFDTHTAGTPIAGVGNIRVATIGAAAGAGVIWTFAEPGVLIPAGTANGIGIAPATGSGQVSDVYFEWDE
jgi:hypothetical protein